MPPLTPSEQVLASLRANVESSDRPGWGTVYLDNARPAGMSEKAFRSCLAALSKDGLYKVVDGYAWGEVRLP